MHELKTYLEISEQVKGDHALMELIAGSYSSDKRRRIYVSADFRE